MLHTEYISEQLRTARQRDLLEAAERSRLAAQARPARRRTLPRLEWRWHRGAPAAESQVCVPSAR